MVSSFEAAKIRIHGQLILRTRVLRPAALLVSGFQSGPVFLLPYSVNKFVCMVNVFFYNRTLKL